jgi:hypothetical protein
MWIGIPAAPEAHCSIRARHLPSAAYRRAGSSRGSCRLAVRAGCREGDGYDEPADNMASIKEADTGGLTRDPAFASPRTGGLGSLAGLTS